MHFGFHGNQCVSVAMNNVRFMLKDSLLLTVVNILNCNHKTLYYYVCV